MDECRLKAVVLRRIPLSYMAKGHVRDLSAESAKPKNFVRINPLHIDSSRERQSLSGTEPPKSQSDFRGRSESAGGNIERYHGLCPWGSMEKRIYFHDTDSGGVVYYGNYLKYLEETRTEFLEKQGMSVAQFQEQGLMYAVSECHILYRSPARYADILICRAKLEKITAVKMIFAQTIHEKKSQRLVVEARVTLVCLSKDFKPTAIPEDLREKLVQSSL